MSFSTIRIGPAPIDETLLDSASVGPELATVGQAWVATPRALLWSHASPEWPLLLVLLPLATRLSLMTHPVFGRLVRDWGLGIRFLGIDARQSLFDFRDLLDSQTLRRLVHAIARTITACETQPQAGNDALDLLFEMLAEDLLTVLDCRRDDWQRHLATEGRLRVDQPGADLAPGARSLFDRRSRHPEFTAQLHAAVRTQLIDVQVYGRILRSMDLREAHAETRILAALQTQLDAQTLSFLTRSRSGPQGAHVGAYNWLRQEPRLLAHRAAVLHKLPVLTQFVADRYACGLARPLRLRWHQRLASGRAAEDFDDEVSVRLLAQALDSGQDRAVIEALALHFNVSGNTVRTLWRQCPTALGSPPEWHLQQILQTLDRLPPRQWPEDDAGWLRFKSEAVPAALVSA